MPATEGPQIEPLALADGLRAFIDRAVERAGATAALKPGHRVKFHWPPHPISYSFHVLASDWTGRATVEIDGEEFPVQVARTPHGVFGRCEPLWLEARADSLEEMLQEMRRLAAPFLARQRLIASSIGRTGRFRGALRELEPLDLLKLLYCADRDVANDAQREIETHARSGLFTPALIEILIDRRHPNRRSAQWCVLDMFEDLPAFCTTETDEAAAVEAIRALIWDAEDDHARTVFKAGVVLGGHIPYRHGGPVLLQCLEAPSPIGRRSAIHGLFHVVEWMPDMKDQVVAALRQVAQSDSEPALREYAACIADDVEADVSDHVQEPLFSGER